MKDKSLNTIYKYYHISRAAPERHVEAFQLPVGTIEIIFSLFGSGDLVGAITKNRLHTQRRFTTTS